MCKISLGGVLKEPVILLFIHDAKYYKIINVFFTAGKLHEHVRGTFLHSKKLIHHYHQHVGSLFLAIYPILAFIYSPSSKTNNATIG